MRKTEVRAGEEQLEIKAARPEHTSLKQKCRQRLEKSSIQLADAEVRKAFASRMILDIACASHGFVWLKK
eukprot:SAG31_NODE_7187_length_1762_cov_1.438966_2_plen_70_part_00